MKIGFFGIKDWEEQYLKEMLVSTKITATFFKEPLSKDSLPRERDYEAISVFVDSVVDKAVLDEFPKLKFVVAESTGYDHIDIETARSRNISVSYVPSYGENTVAEYAFALLLSLSRKIYLSYDRVREEGNFNIDGLQGFDLKGKTIGVVGVGRIGRHVVRMALGFEMKVIAFDSHPDQNFATKLGFSYVSLEQLLSQSDIVTLHVPYMPETHHLINTESLAKVKKGAYLINTSRGAVIDTIALVDALKSGQLGGAGLDVLEEEGAIKDELSLIISKHPEEHNLKTILADHVLIDMPNVIITPHNAFNTREALERIHSTTIENINAFMNGKPINLVP